MHHSRRDILRLGTGAVLIASTPLSAFAVSEELRALEQEMFGAQLIEEGRVNLELPPISENGFSVPLSISIDSPMTVDDHVQRVALFAPGNPEPFLAGFQFGPHNGKAVASTRIRLAKTQTLSAVAEMSDGSLWRGSAETVVTLAACVVL